MAFQRVAECRGYSCWTMGGALNCNDYCASLQQQCLEDAFTTLLRGSEGGARAVMFRVGRNGRSLGWQTHGVSPGPYCRTEGTPGLAGQCEFIRLPSFGSTPGLGYFGCDGPPSPLGYDRLCPCGLPFPSPPTPPPSPAPPPEPPAPPSPPGQPPPPPLPPLLPPEQPPVLPPPPLTIAPWAPALAALIGFTWCFGACAGCRYTKCPHSFRAKHDYCTRVRLSNRQRCTCALPSPLSRP